MSQYFEAIVQIRPQDEEVIAFAKSQLANDNVHIAKEIVKKFGTDLYVSSNKYAIALGSKLKKRFGGTIKLSRSLYGVRRKQSKLSYRVTVCFRLPEPEEPEE